MTPQEKIKIQSLVSDGSIQKAIDKLLSIKRNKSLDKEALAIASRHNSLQRKERLGTLSFEQFKLAENQIIEHLIALINHPENKAYPAERSIEKDHKPGFVLRKYLIFAAIAAIVLLSLAEAFHIIDIFPSSHQLTVFVEDEKDNPALEGKGRINIALGNRSLNEAIGENGRINFPDITPNNIGDTITVGLEAEGWEIISKKTFVFIGDPVTVKVKRDNSLGIIKGTVRSRDGQAFIEGAKVTVKDTFTYTNKNGRFKIILPEKMRVKNEMEDYILTVSKPGYKTRTKPHNPNSTDADIRLDKIENR